VRVWLFWPARRGATAAAFLTASVIPATRTVRVNVPRRTVTVAEEAVLAEADSDPADPQHQPEAASRRTAATQARLKTPNEFMNASHDERRSIRAPPL
jgi:hypothetical protein